MLLPLVPLFFSQERGEIFQIVDTCLFFLAIGWGGKRLMDSIRIV